jgi:hypothetical protein
MKCTTRGDIQQDMGTLVKKYETFCSARIYAMQNAFEIKKGLTNPGHVIDNA